MGVGVFLILNLVKIRSELQEPIYLSDIFYGIGLRMVYCDNFSKGLRIIILY